MTAAYLRTRTRERGFTLIEMFIAAGILAVVCMLIYSAFAGMRTSKEGVGRVDERFLEGREAVRRISRELASAYISLHRPINQSLLVTKTSFIGTRGSPADRVDFNAFANQRFDKNSHDSDQAEISYFGSPDTKQSGVTDLVRRISPKLDLNPQRGGRIDVLATDIDLFKLRYLDPLTGQWVETWDSTDLLTRNNTLPLYAHIKLVLNGGRRAGAGRGQGTLTFETKVAIPMNQPLSFAIPH